MNHDLHSLMTRPFVPIYLDVEPVAAAVALRVYADELQARGHPLQAEVIRAAVNGRYPAEHLTARALLAVVRQANALADVLGHCEDAADWKDYCPKIAADTRDALDNAGLRVAGGPYREKEEDDETVGDDDERIVPGGHAVD